MRMMAFSLTQASYPWPKYIPIFIPERRMHCRPHIAPLLSSFAGGVITFCFVAINPDAFFLVCPRAVTMHTSLHHPTSVLHKSVTSGSPSFANKQLPRFIPYQVGTAGYFVVPLNWCNNVGYPGMTIAGAEAVGDKHNCCGMFTTLHKHKAHYSRHS